jgi:hypothetical protein
MPRQANKFRHFRLLSARFLGPAVLGSGLMIFAALFEATGIQLAALGCLVSVASGVALAYLSRGRDRTIEVERPAIPPVLANRSELARLYEAVSDALLAVAGQSDGNRKEVTIQKLIALGVQFQAIASGAGTLSRRECWYVAHDAVLTIPDLREYRAVVRVGTTECAHDPAIQESLRATFAAAHRGVLVERILVLPDVFWPVGRLLPTDDIFPWIDEQQTHGLRVILLREGELPAELRVSTDTCVFDDWAVGTRELDTHAQTIRVALDFAPDTVRAAIDRLDRLSHIGIPFGDLLDRAGSGR